MMLVLDEDEWTPCDGMGPVMGCATELETRCVTVAETLGMTGRRKGCVTGRETRYGTVHETSCGTRLVMDFATGHETQRHAEEHSKVTCHLEGSAHFFRQP